MNDLRGGGSFCAETNPSDAGPIPEERLGESPDDGEIPEADEKLRCRCHWGTRIGTSRSIGVMVLVGIAPLGPGESINGRNRSLPMEKHQHHPHHYRRLTVMAGLSFIAMFILMYAMVDVMGNVYSNLNQVYMAGLMAMPMVAIELLVMGTMYPNKRLNAALIGGSVVIGAIFFAAIRQQTLIDDRQFLRSMIPHHAGALLMCREAEVQDPEIRELCENIAVSQQREIDQMKAIMQRLAK